MTQEDAVSAPANTPPSKALAGRSRRAGRSRARRGEGELLRDDILDATERLLLQTGDESAVSIRAIAKAVGVTSPSIYLHFKDKDELMLACCERRFAEFTEYVRDAMAGHDDPVQALRELGRAYVRWGLERPEPYRILFMNPHPAGEAHDELHAGEELADLPGMDGFFLLVGAVQRAMEAGAMREADPILVAVGLWTVVHGITSLLIAMRPEDHPDHFPWPGTDALIDHQIETQLLGLVP